jgi:hypothetical protein
MDILMCLCVVFILLIIHTIWPKYVHDPQYEKFKVVNVLKDPPDIELNTGDIVFVNNCAKCKYTDDHMNNGFQYVYRNMFNSFRWYVQGRSPYTHTAIILRLNIDGISKPYICHIDGGAPMYDELRHKYIAGAGPVVSSLHHINVCGGEVHVYKYKGPKIDNDMTPWVMKNRNIKYPNSMYKLTMVNGLQRDKNPDGVMACTDFVENTLHHIGVLDKKFVSGQSTINDVLNIVRTHDCYSHTPVVLKNKCFDAKHFG